MLDARSLKTNVMGGGIVFNFDPALAEAMGEPVLLPGNRGWTWGNAQGRRIEMRFEPALARVYFEPGDRSQIRAFLYKDRIQPGREHFTATFSVAGDVALGPTAAERFGVTDPKSWPSDRLDWKTAPVDLSFLNAPEKPAGKRGFVKAVGEQLLFADNTPARFWGTNLSAYTLFQTPDDAIKLQAKRLSALGFNLVRLHHHDSWWVLPNIFGDGRKVHDTQRLSEESLKKLDLWIKCLKDEGIYVWLDMHVQRALWANDNIFAFDELPKNEYGIADLKGYAYVNETIQRAMKRFAKDYLSHVNSYTGLAYKDDPAVAAVLITNENDITQHFGNALLPDKSVPKHNELYMKAAKAFAKQHDLPEDQTWRSWEPGPAKLFLNDLERRFNVDMIESLRETGVKVPIATTSSWGGNGLSALPALTAGDVVDVHIYGGPGTLEKNPLTSASLVDWIGAGQVVGKPLTVTEWNNEPFPIADRHSLPLYMAGTASHQGWDALMQYAYSQENSPSNRNQPATGTPTTIRPCWPPCPPPPCFIVAATFTKPRPPMSSRRRQRPCSTNVLHPTARPCCAPPWRKASCKSPCHRHRNCPGCNRASSPGTHRCSTTRHSLYWTPRPANPPRTPVNSSATGNKASTPSIRLAPRRPPAGSAASRSSWAISRCNSRPPTPASWCKAWTACPSASPQTC